MSFTTKSLFKGVSVTVTGLFDDKSSITAKDIMLNLIRNRFEDETNTVDFIPYKSEYVTQEKEDER